MDQQEAAQWWWAHGSVFAGGLIALAVALADAWYFHHSLGDVLDGALLTAGFGAVGVPGIYTAGRIKGQTA